MPLAYQSITDNGALDNMFSEHQYAESELLNESVVAMLPMTNCFAAEQRGGRRDDAEGSGDVEDDVWAVHERRPDQGGEERFAWHRPLIPCDGNPGDCWKKPPA